MSRKILIAACAALIASPTLAATCTQPYPPQIAIPANAAEGDLAQARDDVQSFIQASDIYQQCLVDAAKRDANFRVRAIELMNASQQQKQRIGETFNAAARTFNGTRLTKTSEARNPRCAFSPFRYDSCSGP